MSSLDSDFDPYYVWLGISAEEQPPHHYRLLGLRPLENSSDVIQNAADRQMKHLHTFQTGKYAALSQRLLNEVAAAKVCLLNSSQKIPYDNQLRQTLATAQQRSKARRPPPGHAAALQHAQATTAGHPPATHPLPVPQTLPTAPVASHGTPSRKKSPSSWILPGLLGATGLAIAVVAVTLLSRQEKPPHLTANNSPSADTAPTTIRTSPPVALADSPASISASEGNRPSPKPSEPAKEESTAPAEKSLSENTFEVEETPDKVVDPMESNMPTNSLPPEDIVRLTKLPVRNHATSWHKLEINSWNQTSNQPMVAGQGCSECLYAHAPSFIVYDIPPDVRHFAAVGYCNPRGGVAFEVLVDDVQLYKSPMTRGETPIVVHLPDDAKQIRLAIDPLGNKNSDHSFWCYPRFYRDSPHEPWLPLMPASHTVASLGTTAERTPLPDADRIAETRKGIREVYDIEGAQKNRLAAAKMAADLLKASMESNDMAERYVLLEETIGMAAVGGNLEVMEKGLDRLQQMFAVPADEMTARRLEAMTQIAARVQTRDKIQYATSAHKLYQDAVSLDDYETAAKCLEILAKLGQEAGVRNRFLAQAVQEGKRQLETLMPAYEQVQAAQDVLAKTPDDPAGNLTVGKFYGLLKGEWERALPYLAHGADTTLQAVSQTDLTAPAIAAERTALADRWWQLAEEKTDAGSKVPLQARAAYWYGKALPAAEITGVSRQKILNRLNTAGLPSYFALEFDGETTQVWTPLKYDGKHPLTIEVVAVIEEHPNQVHYRCILGNWSQTGVGIGYQPSKSEIYFQLHDGKAYRNALAPLFYSHRQHLCGVYDGTFVRFFVNGEIVGTPPRTQEPHKVSPNHFLIGTHFSGNGKTYGQIEEVRISKSARYRTSFTPERRLLADDNTLLLYHFDEGEGNMLTDHSGNNNHGKIKGRASWTKLK